MPLQNPPRFDIVQFLDSKLRFIMPGNSKPKDKKKIKKPAK